HSSRNCRCSRERTEDRRRHTASRGPALQRVPHWRTLHDSSRTGTRSGRVDGRRGSDDGMRSRPRIKICGITRQSDADLAVELGADALGFVFWPRSPRAVTVEAAARLHSGLPPFVTRVGVFVNATPEVVAAAVRDAGLDVVQLHGDESAADYV